ncbi:MAG: hypothetical protein GXO78_15510 [Calditrichaeota bacterium]|nr:hypothetical protein [Calditrichota bacterium]
MKVPVWLFLLVFCINVFSQEARTTEERARVFDIDLQQLEKTNEQIIPQRQLLEQALERQIDSTTYIVGPGDQLLLKIWGVMETQFITEVTPEGFVIIPGISQVYVANETLAEASKKIRQALAQSFKNSRFTVRLLRLRKFKVFVVGEIENPGTYYLRASDRVSDAIQLAGGLTNWGDDTRIQVRHYNGRVDTINISEFYLTGNLNENPHLNGGDVIYVPPIDLKENYVIIEGNVGSQGVYQILPNETLYEFLTRLQAINRRSDIENIVLIRGTEKKYYNLLKSETRARVEMLQTGDRIIIPSTREMVYVKGEVTQPGPYPYLANYTALDYAGFAGVLETAKSLKDIMVIHTRTGKVEKGADVIVEKGDIVIVPRRNRELLKDYLAIITPIISLGISAYALIRAAR